jgi:signal transduction histidine kinase
LRARLALALNLFAASVALTAAALTWDSSDWQPTNLLLALGAFAVASELLPIELRPRSHPLGGWFFTSSAPFVLAAVCLGPAPAATVALFALAVSALVERSPWHELVANAANYAVFSVAGALAAGAAVGALDVGDEDPELAVLVTATYAFVLVLNFAMTAGYSALADGERVRAAAANQWRLQLAAEAPIALMTGLTVHLYGTSGLGALALLAAVQLIFVQLARELHRSIQRGDRISQLSASRSRLVGQILAAEEGERRRLAEALHYDAMQNLLCARQDLDSAANEPRVERARVAVDASIDRLREAIFELHPTVLEHVGLAAAVEAVALTQGRRAGFEVRVEVLPAGASELDSLIFTVCRELLANAAEHAAPANVTVRVEELGDRINIEVSDDGRGFDRRTLNAAVGRGHIGLASICERIEALGGSVEIESQPGAGTRVKVVLPTADRTLSSTRAEGLQRGLLGRDTHVLPGVLHGRGRRAALALQPLGGDHAQARECREA